MNYISREEICEYLNPIYDLERLIGRISYQNSQSQGSDLHLRTFPGNASLYQNSCLGEFQSAAFEGIWRQDLDPLEDLV